MTKSCKEYREQAWNLLDGKWNSFAIVAAVIFAAAMISSLGEMSFHSAAMKGLSSSLGLVISVLFITPMGYAMMVKLLGIVRGDEFTSPALNDCFEILKKDFDRYVISGLLMLVMVVIVSLLTLGIGGIILGLAYSMVPFILHDHPDMSAKDALRASRLMMRGHKMELFILNLSFIGWILLGILTCGIGLLWVSPYMSAAEAAFYEDLSHESTIEVVE